MAWIEGLGDLAPQRSASSYLAGSVAKFVDVYSVPQRDPSGVEAPGMKRRKTNWTECMGYERCRALVAATGPRPTAEEQRAHEDLAFWELLAELWSCGGAEAEALVRRKARSVPAPALLLRGLVPFDFGEMSGEALRDFWTGAVEWLTKQLEQEGRTDHVMLAQEDVRIAAFKSIKKWRFFQPRKDEDGARQEMGEIFAGHRTGVLEVSEEARVRDPHRGLDAVLLDCAGCAHGLSALAHGLASIEAAEACAAAILDWSDGAVLLARCGQQYVRLTTWPPPAELLLTAARARARAGAPPETCVVEVPSHVADQGTRAVKSFASAVLEREVEVEATAEGWRARAASEPREESPLPSLAPSERDRLTEAMWTEAWEQVRLGLASVLPELALWIEPHAAAAELTGLAAHALAQLWTEQLVTSRPAPSAVALSQAALFLAGPVGSAALACRVLEAHGVAISFAAQQRTVAALPQVGPYFYDLRWTRPPSVGGEALASRRWLRGLSRRREAWARRVAEEAAQRVTLRCLAEDHCTASRWWRHVALEDEVCPGCKSKDTRVIERFDRASDEASTIVMWCFRCCGVFRRSGSEWVRE